jgi:hypothetical protein
MARCAVPVAERSVRRRNEWRCASYPARFVTPAPCGHGQHSSLSSTIFETAISEQRFKDGIRLRRKSVGLKKAKPGRRGAITTVIKLLRDADVRRIKLHRENNDPRHVGCCQVVVRKSFFSRAKARAKAAGFFQFEKLGGDIRGLLKPRQGRNLCSTKP